MAGKTQKMLNSPIRWVGGKSRFRKFIIPLIPEHTCYVEPFAGGAWILFGKPPSPVEVLNDIDQELINFFRILKHQSEALIASFEWELVSRAEFEHLANLDPSTLSEIERAHRFYYLIMAGWGGELDYPRFQTSISDGGHGNRLIGALKHLRKRLEPVHKRLSTVIIENLSWEACIDRYDREKTIMYIDPPYPQNGCNYKHNMQDWNDHRKLANRLAQTKCRWILSSYDVPEIHALYDGYHIIPVQTYSGMRVKKNGSERVVNREVIITNFDPKSNAPIKNGHSKAIVQPSLLPSDQPPTMVTK
ncbi:MAG: DNA adenine methylase [Anaerolineales bacterium]|nr:DNA adenine methylase [Anaerolineales bacterium]